jgi:hypothetical protein
MASRACIRGDFVEFTWILGRCTRMIGQRRLKKPTNGRRKFERKFCFPETDTDPNSQMENSRRSDFFRVLTTFFRNLLGDAIRDHIPITLFSSDVVTHRSRNPSCPVSFTWRAASSKPVIAAR